MKKLIDIPLKYLVPALSRPMRDGIAWNKTLIDYLVKNYPEESRGLKLHLQTVDPNRYRIPTGLRKKYKPSFQLLEGRHIYKTEKQFMWLYPMLMLDSEITLFPQEFRLPKIATVTTERMEPQTAISREDVSKFLKNPKLEKPSHHCIMALAYTEDGFLTKAGAEFTDTPIYIEPSPTWTRETNLSKQTRVSENDIMHYLDILVNYGSHQKPSPGIQSEISNSTLHGDDNLI